MKDFILYEFVRLNPLWKEEIAVFLLYLIAITIFYLRLRSLIRWSNEQKEKFFLIFYQKGMCLVVLTGIIMRFLEFGRRALGNPFQAEECIFTLFYGLLSMTTIIFELIVINILEPLFRLTLHKPPRS